MKFFRWLLSNLFLIIVVVGLIYTYVYWGNLAGSDTPGGKAIAYLSDEFVEVREFVDGIKDKNNSRQNKTAEHNENQVENIDQHEPVGKTAVPPKKTVMTESQPIQDSTAATEPEKKAIRKIDTHHQSQPVASTDGSVSQAKQPAGHASPDRQTVAVLKQPPATISYSHNQQRIEQNSAGEVIHKHSVKVDTLNNTGQPGPLSSDSRSPSRESTSHNSNVVQKPIAGKGSFVPPEVEKELENAGADGDVAALTPEAIKKVWIEARKSFYKREYEQCEKRYKRVIAMTENNFDAYGELGNVYFHQGKNKEAAEAYMQAALILVDIGQVERARSLIGLMQFLDKDKAEQLKQKIESAQ